MRSLDQRRAAAAYGAIATARPGAVDLARKLPSMLQTNGLLATWAFLLPKEIRAPGQTPLPFLLRHLQSLELDVPAGGDLPGAFLYLVGGGQGATGGVSGPALRELTAEALAFAGWLKRAAEARGDEAPGDEPQGTQEGSDAAA